jgi:predicted HTH domain antitoxin
MSVVIADKFLEQAGLSEQEALVEFACHLFDTGKLALWPAAQLAGLTRGEMEDELISRGIALYRITAKELAEDLDALKRIRGAS